MANRDNHYEAAFEEFLRARGVPYVAVDEARLSLMSDGESIKSLDFIVAAPGRTTWLVDVKGRRFPSGDQTCQYWKNWAPQEDLISLANGRAFLARGSRDCSFLLTTSWRPAPLPANGCFAFATASTIHCDRLDDYTAWAGQSLRAGHRRHADCRVSALGRAVEMFLASG